MFRISGHPTRWVGTPGPGTPRPRSGSHEEAVAAAVGVITERAQRGFVADRATAVHAKEIVLAATGAGIRAGPLLLHSIRAIGAAKGQSAVLHDGIGVLDQNAAIVTSFSHG